MVQVLRVSLLKVENLVYRASKRGPLIWNPRPSVPGRQVGKKTIPFASNRLEFGVESLGFRVQGLGLGFRVCRV